MSTERPGVLTVAGDVDAATVGDFERALRSAEHEHLGEDELVVDVGGVEFMDSSGLRALVAASVRAGERGSRVRLRNLRPDLARLLEITGLSDMFGVTQ